MGISSPEELGPGKTSRSMRFKYPSFFQGANLSPPDKPLIHCITMRLCTGYAEFPLHRLDDGGARYGNETGSSWVRRHRGPTAARRSLSRVKIIGREEGGGGGE
ncbi:unnamed protein product, partial [Gadus morhua 'NCC']